jgi:hypothetical protein
VRASYRILCVDRTLLPALSPVNQGNRNRPQLETVPAGRLAVCGKDTLIPIASLSAAVKSWASTGSGADKSEPAAEAGDHAKPSIRALGALAPPKTRVSPQAAKPCPDTNPAKVAWLPDGRRREDQVQRGDVARCRGQASFALPGFLPISLLPSATHGLRGGLYSPAALRLSINPRGFPVIRVSVLAGL